MLLAQGLEAVFARHQRWGKAFARRCGRPAGRVRGAGRYGLFFQPSGACVDPTDQPNHASRILNQQEDSPLSWISFDPPLRRQAMRPNSARMAANTAL